MCGRYGLKVFPGGLIRRLGGRFRPRPDFRPRYNIAPTQPVLAVVNDVERTATDLRWGLVPYWADSPSAMKLTTFNARIETIAAAPAYREALRRKRCAILASGYYEWRKNGDGSKTPMWIQRKDDEPFAFAGLWSTWKRGDDVLRSCTIVTQPPTAFMSAIHSKCRSCFRMVPPIDGSLAASGTLAKCWRSSNLRIHPIGTRMRSRGGWVTSRTTTRG